MPDDDVERPGEYSPLGASSPPRQPVVEDEPGVPEEIRDSENLASPSEAPGYLDEDEQDPHTEVAETVGTTELPAGIGDTEFPAGVMSGEDPDASGGASDIDQGW